MIIGTLKVPLKGEERTAVEWEHVRTKLALVIITESPHFEAVPGVP